MANHCHNTPGALHTTPTSDRRPAVLTQDEWDELHDALELALDALGDGPQDVHMPYLINSMIHQRVALRLTHSKARDNGRPC